uniref:Uncharacterized protein n=1 Tax=Rhizophora mucronata TaxID=61149 RepID=A0A2P2NE08_RHIMU
MNNLTFCCRKYQS